MRLRTIGVAIAVTWAVAITLGIVRIVTVLDSVASRPEAPRPLAVDGAPSGRSEMPTPPAAPRAPENALADAAVRASPSDPETSPEQEEARQRAEEALGRMQSNGSVDDDSIEEFRQAIRAMRPDDRIDVLGAFAVAASSGEIKADRDDLVRVLQ